MDIPKPLIQQITNLIHEITMKSHLTTIKSHQITTIDPHQITIKPPYLWRNAAHPIPGVPEPMRGAAGPSWWGRYGDTKQ